ncbi:hypothetical protein QR680_017110 [Steinernema hermaphroditum]|uniref:Uncharacterized protein n=1 Tax=Steinernema hermaphroditum TaxID=289476 RepID=A0AA39LNE6_9BILA|nr:hypothetical protein QR680_017110 [Steinernema hermaphroditum]
MRPLLLLAAVFSTALSVRILTCHFTMRDFFGNYVDVMRKCPPGTSYCAARVINSTGWNSLVIDYFDWYCENEKNISRHLRTSTPPPEGCYTYAPNHEEHVCFCDRDFCNEKTVVEGIFLRHVEREEKFHAQRMRELALQEQFLRHQKFVQHPHRRPLHQIQNPPPPPPPPPTAHAPPPPPATVTKRPPHARRPPNAPVVSAENALPPQADVRHVGITVTRVGDTEHPDEEGAQLTSDAYGDEVATLTPVEPEVRELSSAEMASKHSSPKATQKATRTRRIQ